MRLIGLAGRKGAGKDSAFLGIDLWSRGSGLVAVRHGFADKLKLSAYRLFKPAATLEQALEWCDYMKDDSNRGTITSYIPHPDGKVYNDHEIRITGRMFLQRYGTEAHREVFGEDFWIDQLLPLDGWRKNFDNADIAVVTDVRFPNEARRILDLGGEVWEIDRDLGKAQDEHASETPLPRNLVDCVIPNHGSKEDLYIEVVKALQSLFNPTPLESQVSE